ncbi:MAG TPA: PDZ domain-containing protein [Gemmatimonadales bacterium]
MNADAARASSVEMAMTRTTRTERRAAAWLRALWLATVAALVAAPGADAQQGGAARPVREARPAERPDLPVALAELEAARRALDANEERLRALATSLAERDMTHAAIDSLVRLQREHQSLAARIRLLEARSRFRAAEVEARRQDAPARPQGWFGVNVTTVAGAGVSPDGRVLVAADYPIIRSVEPGSPAARAGLQAGDRIVTILGRDLRRENVDLARVLRPGLTVPVHIIRDGRPLDLAVAVTARPSSFAPARIRVSTGTIEAPGPSRAPRRGERVRVMVRAPEPPAAVAAPDPASVPRPATYLFTSNPRVAPVAGAEVMTLTEGLRRTHDVDGGVFVVSVLPRTPADAAGIQAGDVLLRADGVRLDEPLDLLRTVRREADGDRKVRIELVRERKGRTVEMRW